MKDDAVERLRLVILCSPSGAGKTTLASMLLDDPSLPGFGFSISHTTRQPRPAERDGRDYHFVDEATFRDMVERDAFAEHASVHGHAYGTSVAEVERIARLPDSRGIVFDIDVQGARQLVARWDHCLTVFVLPPSIEVLERRLRGRGTESDEALELRMRNAVDEIRCWREFDHIIVNDGLEDAYAELRSVVVAHGTRRHFMGAAAQALVERWDGESGS